MVNTFPGLEEAFPDKRVFSNGKNSILAIGLINYCANDGNSKVDKKVLGKLTDFFVSRGMDLSLEKNNDIVLAIKSACKKDQKLIMTRLLNDRINKAIKQREEVSKGSISQDSLIDKFNKRQATLQAKKKSKANQPNNS